MPVAIKNFLTLGVIALLIAGFLLFWEMKPENILNGKAKRTLSSELETPDAESYMIDIQSSKFSVDGSRDFILKAKRSLYFKEGNYFEISDPHFVAFSDNLADNPWELTAEQGRVYGNGEKLILNQQVDMRQEIKPGQFNQLKTSTLTFYPKEKRAESNALVEISTPGSVTRGVGMDANLSKETFALHSQVKGVHFGF